MSRYDELLSLYLDGDPSDPELDELAALLREDNALAIDFREQLIVWEHFSQSVAPERSLSAFEEAMQVRLRAEMDAVAFQNATRKRIRTFKILRFSVPLAALAAVVALVAGLFWNERHDPVDLNTASMIPVFRTVEVKGESVCTQCTLHQEGPHNKAIRFTNGLQTTQILLLESDPELRPHTRKFCGGPNHVHATGEIHDAGGIPQLAVAVMEFPGE